MEKMMPKYLLILIVAASAAWGQPSNALVPDPIPSQTYPNLSTSPVGGDHFQFRELLSTTSQRICSRSTLDVARTSATVLTMGGSASATVPEYIRFPTTDMLITSTKTATLSGGTAADVGVVTIYGGVVGGSAGAPGTPTIYVNNPLPTATITCSGCTTVVSTSGPPFGALKIHTWNVSAGNWVISGGIDLQANRTCDIDLISCADNNGGNHSFTVSDAQSAALPIVPTVIPNTTVNNITVIAWPGGTRADGGATWLAGTASSIYCSVRGVIR